MRRILSLTLLLQTVIKGPPDYWRIAIQSNDEAKDTVIRKFTRTKGGGGSYGKSKPTFAYFLAEVDTPATPATIRDAFWASVIPERFGKDFNKVIVDKA